MDWPTRYLIACIFVVATALASRDMGRFLLSLTLLASWVNENYWRNTLGFQIAWVPVAATDIAFAAVTTAIGLEWWANRRLAALLVALYAAREALQIAALLWMKHGYAFYAGLNIVYALQLLALGGWSLHALAADRSRDRGGGVSIDVRHVHGAGARAATPHKTGLERLWNLVRPYFRS